MSVEPDDVIRLEEVKLPGTGGVHYIPDGSDGKTMALLRHLLPGHIWNLVPGATFDGMLLLAEAHGWRVEVKVREETDENEPS